MAATKRRENTFRIDYANVPKKPTSEEVHRFVGETLGLKREEVLRIQYSRYNGIAFVKTSCLEVAQKVVEENDDQHELTIDGKPYKLRLMMEDGAVVVRLHNLSEDVTDDKISKFLSTHGEVLSIREEQADEKHFFSGLPTGVRNVRMTIQKGIASYVTIDGETTHVSYNGQQQTCRHCIEYTHNGISCVQNKKLLLQKLATATSSYADVTKNPKQIRSKPNSPTSNRQLSRPAKPKDKVHPAAQEQTPPYQEPGTGHDDEEAIEVDDDDSFLRPDGVHPEENNTWNVVTRKSGSQKKKTDGNDTDTSTSSNRSLRSKAKKSRCEEKNNAHTQNPNH